MENVYNVGFVNEEGFEEETQLKTKPSDSLFWGEEELELVNLLLSLKEELCIKEVTYVEYIGQEEVE